MKTMQVCLLSIVFCLSAVSGRASAARMNSFSDLPITISWGHQSPEPRWFFIRLKTADTELVDATLQDEEEGDRSLVDGGWHTRAGGGDLDQVRCLLRVPLREIKRVTEFHSTWEYLITRGDEATSQRLRDDAACRRDDRRLAVSVNAEGTRGFTVTVDQLIRNKAIWLPALDIFIATGSDPPRLAEHLEAIRDWRGRQILDRVARESEASYQQFTEIWPDMGDPRYENPYAPPPGHVIGLSWDSAIHKFGIDRAGGVWSDYGDRKRYRFWFDFASSNARLPSIWRGQYLENGLPVVTTAVEDDGVRYEVEQHAYPLAGPPAERRGDISMVLMQKITLRELGGKPRQVDVGMVHQRDLSAGAARLVPAAQAEQWAFERPAERDTALVVEGRGLALKSNTISGAESNENHIVFTVELPARGQRELVVKLPDSFVRPVDRHYLLELKYASARKATIDFWEAYLARGARLEVPEANVNRLFRANLWHALRLPRRHGGCEPQVRIDLPYSNFAYDQTGSPWPVNQAVYVDYMLYDLRGYHGIATEELATMFRSNQQPDGRVAGFANWGVYTPSMIYAVAKSFLLSDDRVAFERLLPQTLKAVDWCLGELRPTEHKQQNSPSTKGLVLAPLNDLSHETRAWAFNQAYFYAGLNLMAEALERVKHPRAEECRAAALQLREAIDSGFGAASLRSPVVQLRDRTWTPYAPSDALTPGRLYQVWYPTDVDSGPLHLARLGAIDADGLLADSMLRDHEDNLFLDGRGMANEPVYNPHATVYLLRDDAQAAIRAFYSMMACAFSHTVHEPVEHRWGWGQYFGPPSTDGAWFELFRNMLIQERDGDTLSLFAATPRRWLEHGKRIEIEGAPTYYGKLTTRLESYAGNGLIRVFVEFEGSRRPDVLRVRFRHPSRERMRNVEVNGTSWSGFDAVTESVEIRAPDLTRYQIDVRY